MSKCKKKKITLQEYYNNITVILRFEKSIDFCKKKGKIIKKGCIKNKIFMPKKEKKLYFDKNFKYAINKQGKNR